MFYVKLVSNPGANLPQRTIERYGILMTPARINADGVLRENSEYNADKLDALIKSSKTHPFPLGTSAAEFITVMRELVSQGDVIVSTASRKLIGSYDAAVAAQRTLASLNAAQASRISVIDTRGADVWIALVNTFIAASIEQGRSRDQIVKAVDSFTTRMTLDFVPLTLDNLAKGGRAAFVKAMAANILQKVPMISLVDGELKSSGLLPRSGDHPMLLAEALSKKVGEKRSVWAAVSHGGDPERGARLMNLLRERLDVRYGFVSELTPGYYLSLGRGALVATLMPTDALPWDVTVD